MKTGWQSAGGQAPGWSPQSSIVNRQSAISTVSPEVHAGFRREVQISPVPG
jgi:hypothetical protein